MSSITPIPFARFRDEILLQCKSPTDLKNKTEALDVLSALDVKISTDLTGDLILRVLSHLKGKPESKIRKALWNIHAFSKQLEKRCALERSPFLNHPDLKQEMLDAARKTPTKSRLTDDQVKRALAELATLAEKDNLAHRAYVSAAVSAYTGWLPAMWPGILVADVDFSARTIRGRRDAGKKAAELVSPLHDDLALIIDGWLASRGHHAGRKLDEPKVAEARRLYAGGWSIDDLADRYGVKRIAMYNAVTGRTWKDAGATSISESERLIPNLNPGPKRRTDGPNRMTGRDVVTYNIIKAAGNAAGIENLTPVDFSWYHKAKYSRRRVDTERNDAVAPLIEPGLGQGVWKIMGTTMDSLTKKPYIRVIKKVYGAWKKGERLTLGQIGDDRKAFKEVKGLHPLWEAIIDMPETEGNRGQGYGFKDRRISI
jgi:hypothetical protein